MFPSHDLRGEFIFYSFDNRKAYSEASETYKKNEEATNTANMIQANEEAYFDNFCQANNI